MVAIASKADAWTAVASRADQQRIARTAQAWSVGLTEARARGFGSAVKAEGKLLTPGGALSRPAPTPGSYSCRLVALGRTAEKRMLDIQPGDVPATFADVEALVQDVGFAPKTPIETGVANFVAWYREYYGIAAS